VGGEVGGWGSDGGRYYTANQIKVSRILYSKSDKSKSDTIYTLVRVISAILTAMAICIGSCLGTMPVVDEV
jgi:hypothetical protein